MEFAVFETVPVEEATRARVLLADVEVERRRLVLAVAIGVERRRVISKMKATWVVVPVSISATFSQARRPMAGTAQSSPVATSSA